MSLAGVGASSELGPAVVVNVEQTGVVQRARGGRCRVHGLGVLDVRVHRLAVLDVS